jgi:hypothetical protein
MAYVVATSPITHPHASFGEITGSSIWPAKAGACGVAVGGPVGGGSGGLLMAAPGWVHKHRGRWRKWLHTLGLGGVGNRAPECPAYPPKWGETDPKVPVADSGFG